MKKQYVELPKLDTETDWSKFIYIIRGPPGYIT
jgi:hypothetical protein